MSKQTSEIITDANGRQIRKFADGTEYDPETKQLVRGPDSTPISRDPVGMNLRGQRKKEIARIKGIIRGTGLPMPPEGDIEALAMAEASAIEVLTACMTNAFLNSQNLRGMAETWTKLTGSRDEEAEEAEVYDPLRDLGRMALEYIVRREGSQG